MLMSATVNAIKYQDESEIYDFLIDFLDKNTQSSKNIKGSSNASLDLKLKNNYNNLLTESENYEADISTIPLNKNLFVIYINKNHFVTVKIVGRIEKIEMIDLNICLLSKIDTGAWRNSLHVDSYKVVDGKLIFKIGNNDFVFNKFKEVKVRSSFGRDQKRYTVSLKMKLGYIEYKSSFSITDRSKMKYSCLIGRKFLSKNKFMVDVTKENINDRIKKS